MRLADELVHLRVRGHVHDDVDLGVLDAADAAAERGVVAGEILVERLERRPSRCSTRLSTPKTQWPSCCSRSARFVPIWPDEPVRRTRIG